MDLVPASVKIKTRSVGNVDDRRLLKRLEYLRTYMSGTPDNRGFRGVDSADGRSGFGERVREVINIERELARRHIPFLLVTNGHHLAIDVFDLPVLGPRPGKKERAAQLAAKGKQ